MINKKPPRSENDLNQSQDKQEPTAGPSGRLKRGEPRSLPTLRQSASSDRYATLERSRPVSDIVSRSDAIAALRRPPVAQQEIRPEAAQNNRLGTARATESLPARTAVAHVDDASLSDRELLKRDGMYTHNGLIQKTQSMLPVHQPQEVREGGRTVLEHTLTMKTPPKVVKIVRAYLSGLGIGAPGSIREVEKYHLDQLWGENGTHHIRFEDMVRELREQAAMPIQWTDGMGVDRTAHLSVKALATRGPKDVDDNSDADKLRRLSRVPIKIKSGYVAVNPAAALALVCLRNRDDVNFARIIAASPSVLVRELLDIKKIRRGPVFTEENIWLLLSFAMPRYVEKGGALTRELEALTLATDNYLSFFNPTLASPPVSGFRKRFVSKYREGLYAHANDPKALAASMERIWRSLCPVGVSPITVLSKYDGEARLEAKIAACVINIFYSAVDMTLEKAASSKDQGAKRLVTAVEIASGAVQTGLNASGAGAAVEAASGLLGTVTSQLAGAAIKHINQINVHSNFREQKDFYRALYQTLKQNGLQGRLVITQPVAEDADLAGFKPSATLLESNPEEAEAGSGAPSSRYDSWVKRFPEIAMLSKKEKELLVANREKFGTILEDQMRTIDALNSFTPI